MTGLLDIAPSNKVVETSFGSVDVPGLSINSLVSVIKKHPELLKLLQQKDMGEIGFENIMDLGLEVTASLLASGLGYAGNAEAIERCKKLKPDDAFDIGQAILEESFPKGAKSFFDKVSRAMETINLKAQVLETNSLNNSQKPVKG